MKKILLSISIIFSILSLPAQGVFELAPMPVCWSLNSVDSSLVALWKLSFRDDKPVVASYLHPGTGQKVDVSAGGTFSGGYCCCKGSSGTGSGSTVLVNELGNGIYNIIVDGDTTQINTQADTNPTTTNIQVGDSTYLSGTVVQDILIALSNQVNTASAETACPDTVSQTAHGFTLGALLGQDQATGTYFPANTANPASLPVAYVCSIIDANTFTVDTEGWLDWTHGQTVRTDYFLQDNGTYAPSPDADYTVFAYRTFKANKAYFDIPELIVDSGSSGGSGGSGGTKNVTASNGLNDQDGGADVDVELGGNLDKPTNINIGGQNLNIESNTSVVDIQATGLRITPNKTTESTRVQGAFLRKNTLAGTNALTSYSPYGLPFNNPLTFGAEYLMRFNNNGKFDWVRVNPAGSGIGLVTTLVGPELVQQPGLGGPLFANAQINLDNTYSLEVRDVLLGDYSLQFKMSQTEVGGNPGLSVAVQSVDGTGTPDGDGATFFVSESSIQLSSFGISGNTTWTVTKDYIQGSGITEYADDAAASADANLPVDGIYTITGSPLLRIKK